MKKIRFLTLITVMVMLFTSIAPNAFAIDYPTVSAKAFVVADMVSGNILYSQNMDEKRAPASLTKIMTGLLAVEAVESGRVKLDDIITAQSDCRTGLDEDSSTVGIQPGEEMTFQDLIYCALVHSANEACNVIAVAVSGSIDAFVQEMNAKAIELGATNTHFLDTCGLTNDVNQHYTTAYDLYVIANEAMQHPLFASIVNTTHYETAQTNMSAPRELSNSNALMTTDGIYGANYLYDGAHGIKTGYTKAAGYCLVSTATKNDVQILCVVMGCDGWLNAQLTDYGNFSQTIKLYNWAFENYSYRTVMTAGDVIEEVEIKNAKDGKNAVLRAEETARLLVPNDASDDDIYVDVTVYDEKLEAPIDPKTVLGEAQIYIKGVKSGKINLVTMDSIELDNAMVRREKINQFFSSGWVKTLIIIIIAALAMYVFFALRYRLKKSRQRRARQEAAERKRKEQQVQQQRARIEANRWAQEEKHRAANHEQIPRTKQTSVKVNTLTPATRELDQDELDEIIRSLGLDKK